MMNPRFSGRAAAVIRLTLLMLVLSISGCAALAVQDQPVVRVVGLTPLPSEGLELRFGLKLRVQNPADHAIEYDGISVSLDLDDRGLGSGVSQQKGTIERFDEAVFEVPITISLFSALRQALARMGDPSAGATLKDIPYSLSGRLGSTDGLAGTRFSSEGKLSLSPRAR